MAIIVILCGAPHLYKKDMNNSGLNIFLINSLIVFCIILYIILFLSLRFKKIQHSLHKFNVFFMFSLFSFLFRQYY